MYVPARYLAWSSEMLDVRAAGGASGSFEAADTAKPKCMQECLSRKISRLLLLEANAIL
jgi:hypothetical protein